MRQSNHLNKYYYKHIQYHYMLFILWYLACLCNNEGSLNNTICDVKTGQCSCKNDLIAGQQCDRCTDGYYNFPQCKGISFQTFWYTNAHIKR